jgi:hypothetical protein
LLSYALADAAGYSLLLQRWEVALGLGHQSRSNSIFLFIWKPAAYWEFFCFYWSVHIARGPSKEKFTMTTARVYSCKGTKQKM